MKKVTYLFFLMSLCASSAAFSQASKSLLEWNEYYRLSWEDFQGKAADGTFGDAGTAVHIKARPFYSGKEIKYDVYAYFNREKSWARDTSASLLAHEQLHFHIAELYARKIRKKIDALAAQGVNDIDVFNAAIKQILTESNEADEQYDLETLHGALPKKQAAWTVKIHEELSLLNDYKKKKRIIGVRKLKEKPHIFSFPKKAKMALARL
jgi:hypothetical protein